MQVIQIYRCWYKSCFSCFIFLNSSVLKYRIEHLQGEKTFQGHATCMDLLNFLDCNSQEKKYEQKIQTLPMFAIKTQNNNALMSDCTHASQLTF